MKTYHVYTGRLNYHEFNKFVCEVKAYNIQEVANQIKKPISEGGHNLNPFYTVIIDVTDGAQIIEHNRHLSFIKATA